MAFTLHAARTGDIPYQYLRYFSSIQEYAELYKGITSIRTGGKTEKGYYRSHPLFSINCLDTGKEIVISAYFLKLFVYHSTSYLPHDYFEQTNKDIFSPVLRGFTTEPMFKLIISHFDSIMDSVEKTLNMPDFAALPRKKQGLALALSVGLFIEEEFQLFPDEAIAVAAAILVMLFPCLENNRKQVLKNINKQLNGDYSST